MLISIGSVPDWGVLIGGALNFVVIGIFGWGGGGEGDYSSQLM